jgi:hypothetical protein
MGLFAAACQVAAAALPTISACMTEILGVFQGLNLLQTVIGLIGTLVASLLAGVGGKIEITVDDQKWKDWKEDFEGYDFNRTLTIGVNIFNAAFIKALMEWLDSDVTKTVKVNMTFGNIEGLLTIVSWTNEDATKNITLKIYDDGEVIGHLMEWVATEDTKKIKVEIEMPVEIPVEDSGEGDGNFWQRIIDYINNAKPTETVDTKSFWDKVFGQPVWQTIDEALGTDGKAVWEVIDEAIANLFGTPNPDPVIIGLDDLIELSEDEDFVYEVNNMFFENMGKVLSEKNIRELKAKFPSVSATDIFKVSNWDNMGEEARQGFVDSMREHFGDAETIEALKKIGANVDDYIQKGIDTNPPSAKVTSGFADGNDPSVKIVKPLNDAIAGSYKATLESGFKQGTDPKTVTANAAAQAAANVQLNSKIDQKKLKSTVQKAVKGVKGTVNLTSQFDKESTPAKVAQKFRDLKPTVTINAQITKTFANDVGVQVGNGIDTVLKNRKYKVNINGTSMTIQAQANGGLVRSGDIFVANENGKSEMIGRFGNQTGVANQDQMVEAMARGVEYANAEQNSLLREQNNLLMRILQKEGTVNIGASSALGRTVRQSLNMYESLVGG